MAEITAALVGKLREMSNAGLMDCKSALVEAKGDLDLAWELLRKKGIASAAKKALRDAKDGVIAQCVQAGARTGVIAEINCETDFVAKNEDFRSFCEQVVKTLASDPKADLEPMRTAQVAKIGENIKVSRFQRFEVSGNGAVAAYIHTGSKIGVLVEVNAGLEATAQNDEFKQLVRDITLQIAAANPTAVSSDQVDSVLVEKEREIAREQVKGKPAQVVEKIVAGKLEKFFQNICLVEQGFVKTNGETTVKDYMAAVGKQIGDTITIKRFVRFQVGEVASA